jgi:hypothetical protein
MHRGDLSLLGISALEATAKAALADHAGPIWLGNSTLNNGSEP